MAGEVNRRNFLNEVGGVVRVPRQDGRSLRTCEPEGTRNGLLAVFRRLIDARGFDTEGQAKALEEERSIA